MRGYILSSLCKINFGHIYLSLTLNATSKNNRFEILSSKTWRDGIRNFHVLTYVYTLLYVLEYIYEIIFFPPTMIYELESSVPTASQIQIYWVILNQKIGYL